MERVELSRTEIALVLATANQVALDILGQRSGVEALRHIAEAARQLAHARFAALGVAHEAGGGLVEFVTTGLTSEQERAIGQRPRGVGILGLLLTRRDPLRIDQISQHPLSAGFPPNHPLMTTFLGVPIRRGETILGSLYLADKIDGSPFTAADEAAVQALAAHAAVAVHHMQLLSRQRSLVSGLIAAQEEERRAVAYDLHDGLTQFVMAAHAHVEAFRRARDLGRTERADRELEQATRYLKEAVIESRRMINGLRSLALEDLGLAGALEQQLHEEKQRAGWSDAEMVHNVAGRRFDRALETAAYRVGQEALTNVRKHANADRVRILLIVQKQTLMLEVRDWGDGFDPAVHSAGGGSHVGLSSMAERVRLLDGAYELISRPGEGTVVRATFPLLTTANAKTTAQEKP